MTQFRDLETMIEILDLTIARQEAEEQFFRRSAQASTSEVAQSLFSGDGNTYSIIGHIMIILQWL